MKQTNICRLSGDINNLMVFAYITGVLFGFAELRRCRQLSKLSTHNDDATGA